MHSLHPSFFILRRPRSGQILCRPHLVRLAFLYRRLTACRRFHDLAVEMPGRMRENGTTTARPAKTNKKRWPGTPRLSIPKAPC